MKRRLSARAAIRALSFATPGGKPYVIAAYTCTPLVTIALDDLKDGAHIKGKPIAELGYGNTPADMISYSGKDPSGKPQDMLMLPLTVLLQPGRVKSGLIAHDTVGPVLHADGLVVLTLAGQEIKRWKVGSDDHDGPRPSDWNVGSVLAGTREPLVVELDAPIDGRDVDYLSVANSSNRRIQGRARLEVGEKRWTFTPDAPWTESRYTLAVFGNLEDASGNRLNGHFESPRTAPEPVAADVYIPLAIDRALVTRKRRL